MINGASIFTNEGIGELYLKDAGIDMVLAHEYVEEKAKFYSDLYPTSEMIVGDIADEKVFNNFVKKFKSLKCKLLLATPPFQGTLTDKEDIRNELVKWVVKAAEATNPKYIMIENVVNSLDWKIKDGRRKVAIKDYIIKSFEKLGYLINHDIFNAADYGTPQLRRSAIFLISKNKLWEFPQAQDRITVRDAIGDLPSLQPGEVSKIKYHYAKEHDQRIITSMIHAPTGKSAHENSLFFPRKVTGEKVKGFNTTYKRMEWDKPAPTITADSGSISSQNNVHPGRENENGTFTDPRVLTLLELFRLFGLPDDWNIPEWANDVFIRNALGESVPPKFLLEFIKALNIDDKK